jgi:hypothetical protein
MLSVTPSGGPQSENPYAEREVPSVSCSVTDQSPSRRRLTFSGPVRSRIVTIIASVPLSSQAVRKPFRIMRLRRHPRRKCGDRRKCPHVVRYFRPAKATCSSVGVRVRIRRTTEPA